MRLKKRPRQGLVEVGELLEGALQQLGVKGDFEKHRLEKKCREILGGKVSQALTGVVMKGSAVQMAFNHAIWMNEMSFRKAEILKKLQQELPQAGAKSITLILSDARKRPLK